MYGIIGKQKGNKMNKEAGAILIEIVAVVLFLSMAGLILKQKEPESEPLQEIPTVIVRITDKNNVIHSREGMLLAGVVTVELSGK
jgi:hypothetical protein